MSIRLTHTPFFPTLARYVKTLRKDVSFMLSAKMLTGTFLLAVVVFLVLGLIGSDWADVYEKGSEGTQNWKEYLFSLLGSIDAKPEADARSVLYSAFVRLVGAIVIGGVITSFLCALAERFAEMKLRGLLVPVMRDHFVVVGYGTMTDDLIRMLLQPEQPNEDLAYWVPHERMAGKQWKREIRKRKVLLCTREDVEKTRDNLNAVLPRSIASRIVYAYGDMDLGAGRDELCEQLRLEDARQIYVLGDDNGLFTGDVGNYAFAKSAAAYLLDQSTCRRGSMPMPIYVCLNSETSLNMAIMSTMEHMDNVDASGGHHGIRSYFKPFSIAEGWARRIWGDAVEGEDIVPLDFAPLVEKKYVHLVVVGMTQIAEALVLEAVRVCHFSNGSSTYITIVDEDAAVGDAFFSRHPSLRDVLPDVIISFLPVRIESEKARNLLRKAALDNDCLLTVAICTEPAAHALSVALNLPEEVYWHRMKGSGRNIRASYRENGPIIWVRQDNRSGLVAMSEVSANRRYENLRAFGMQERGFIPWCLRGFLGMYLNAVYEWPNEWPNLDGHSWLDKCDVPTLKGRISEFRDKWALKLPPHDSFGVYEIDAKEKKDLLLAILAEGADKEVRRFQEYAFRQYIKLPPALRLASDYASDSYGAVFRSLGLRAVYAYNTSFSELVRKNDLLFEEAREIAYNKRSLYEVEHNRWIADRAIMGYRAPRPGTGEIRDNDFRYHNYMIPFDDLEESEKGKDELSISCIPIFVALEGIRLVSD